MLINLTLLYLTSSNFAPSPLFSGQISNAIIQKSYISKSFSHFAYFSKINQIRTDSSYFLFFLKTPFVISNEPVTVGRAWTCFLFRTMDIQREPLTMVLFSLCVFNNTKDFISADSITYISLSKSIFEYGNEMENGIEVNGCQELYISKTIFKDCKYKNSLIQGQSLQKFVFQNCEINNCQCKYIFEIPNKIEDFQITFDNFINSGECLFSRSSHITISYCYFKNVKYVMECTQTPMGCLSSVNIVSCSANGTIPNGCNGVFNNNAVTTIYIDTFETGDCDFKQFTEFTTPPATPTETPSMSLSKSQTPTPEPTSTPEPTPEYPPETATVSETPNETPTATVSETPGETPIETATETPSLTPLATSTPAETPKETPTASQSPMASQSPKATLSLSPSQSEPPTETPPESAMATATPEPTKKKFPVLYIVLIVIICIIVIVIIIIIIICCIRKCSDMKQENLLDRGLMLKYDSAENSETTSDRSNALNVRSESFANVENSEDENDEGFFRNRIIHRNNYINQDDEIDENESSSSL